ncbi:unnamed protein product [Paramecium primaurelia]|uniref:Uncharacterized protein n=1 Tax=Paramecium primaurelia TaxID=5886 RepID=A0A8S1P4A0_PARPR|nr:unnamed protein product [Paramecium primaurelia]
MSLSNKILMLLYNNSEYWRFNNNKRRKYQFCSNLSCKIAILLRCQRFTTNIQCLQNLFTIERTQDYIIY